MNLNTLAVQITKLEGKKTEVNIAQVKEVLSCLGYILNKAETEVGLSESSAIYDKLIAAGSKRKVCCGSCKCK